MFVDFFDTVVFRRVHPFDVIKIWAERVRAPLKMSCDAAVLYTVRMESLSQFDFSNLRYTYREWMEVLFSRLYNEDLVHREMEFEDFYQISLATEENVEKKVQFANEKIIGQLRLLKEQNKKLHIVSDFYLPKSSVRKFLENLGVAGLFDSIFVSCDHKKTKREGTLYPAVLEQLDIKADQGFMIGDNYRSDFLNARKNGMDAHYIKHEYNSVFRKITHRVSHANSCRRRFQKAWRGYEAECRQSTSCFSEYALIYYFFTEKLFFNLEARGIGHVIFLAREGWMLKKFFEIYMEKNPLVRGRVKVHYLKISRQTAGLMRLKPLGKETFSQVGSISVHDFMLGCGFSLEQEKELAEEFERDFSETVENFTQTRLYAELVAHPKFRAFYEKNIAENKEAFRRYYASLGIPAGKETAIVDVGWTGRMQDAIHEITGERTIGFYLGLKEPASLVAGSSKHGLIFSTQPYHSQFYDILSVNAQLYEQLLMAPHGSAISYSLDEKGESVVHENYRDEERDVFQSVVQPVQGFMVDIFRRLCDDPRLFVKEWGGENWLYPEMARMVAQSGLIVNGQRRRFIAELSRGFVDNFGSVRVGKHYDVRKVLNRGTALAWVKSPGRILKYAVKICTLKTAFIRRVLFVLFALPYYIWIRFALLRR
ncbi:MAG: HAD hydrolase-like protein [Puniceicoccales bacterium]|nr:HAD hydrolase-like protein [Puniceicoccales bacterium]